MKKICFCIPFSFVLFLSTCVTTEKIEIPKKEFTNSSLSQTNITPVLQYKIGNENIIYCSSFQIGWSCLQNDIFNEPIKIEDPPNYVEFLNKNNLDNSLIPECYIARSGFVSDGIISQIKSDLKNKFNTNNDSIDNYTGNPNDIIMFSYLEKEISFKQEFDDIDTHWPFSDGKRLRYFGIDSFSSSKKKYNELSKITHIYYSDNEDQRYQIVKIDGDNDEIIFSLFRNEEIILADEVSRVLDIIQSKREIELHDTDCIAIPIQKFQINYQYHDLIGKRILNNDFTKYEIENAIQNIDFTLNKSGVKLKSYSFMGVAESAVESNFYIFDKPYLVIMREKGKPDPYLVLLNNTSELLVVVD